MLWGQTQWGQTQWGQVTGAAPAFQSQSPAPDATGVDADAPIYAEIADSDGDLAAGSVRIYLNGTLAWAGDRAAPGFTGSRVAVSNGYGYTIQPGAPFEAGVQAVRGTATDGAANTMNETYQFTTRALQVTEADIEAQAAVDARFDLDLDASHDIAVASYDLVLTAGADEIAQRLLVGLRLFRGEWYLDEDAGVPYYRDLFVNAPSTRVIEAMLRTEILGDADIERIAEFSMRIDRGGRALSVDFEALSKVGEVDVSAVLAGVQ